MRRQAIGRFRINGTRIWFMYLYVRCTYVLNSVYAIISAYSFRFWQNEINFCGCDWRPRPAIISVLGILCTIISIMKFSMAKGSVKLVNIKPSWRRRVIRRNEIFQSDRLSVECFSFCHTSRRFWHVKSSRQVRDMIFSQRDVFLSTWSRANWGNFAPTVGFICRECEFASRLLYN